MRSYIGSSLGLAVILGLVIAVGCSSSDDSGAGGGGTGGASAGSGGKAASGGSAGKSSGGSTSAGTGGSGEAGKTDNGGDTGGITEGGAGGEAGGDTGGPSETAGAGGADTGPKACNDLVFSGAMGTFGHAPTTDAPTTFTYGTLQVGNYRLTQATVYDGSSGSEELGGLARVAVNGETVTIDIYSTGDEVTPANTETFQLTMGVPSTIPPTNVKLSCATLSSLSTFVGQDVTGQLKYSAAASSFTLFEVPFSTAYTFTLITS